MEINSQKLKLNKKQSLKVALRQIRKNGKENMIVVDENEANSVKGIIRTNIKVKNSFSIVEVGLGANSGR